MTTNRPMTEGEYRVGRDFNPSGDIAVAEIKKKAAALIDFIESVVQSTKAGTPEAHRCAAIAKTEIENAAMWAIKAVTKRDKP